MALTLAEANSIVEGAIAAATEMGIRDQRGRLLTPAAVCLPSTAWTEQSGPGPTAPRARRLPASLSGAPARNFRSGLKRRSSGASWLPRVDTAFPARVACRSSATAWSMAQSAWAAAPVSKTKTALRRVSPSYRRIPVANCPNCKGGLETRPCHLLALQVWSSVAGRETAPGPGRTGLAVGPTRRAIFFGIIVAVDEQIVWQLLCLTLNFLPSG